MLYGILRPISLVLFRIFFDFRSSGSENVPREGGAVLASNHQSFLDPVLLGLGLSRRIGFVARTTLFRNPLFGRLIRSLGALSIDREAADIGTMRAISKLLREGHLLVMFPEGTRTRDGSIGRCKAGAALSARAGGVPVVPVAIHGSFEAWPRHRKLPRPFHPIRIRYGEPVRYPRGTDRAEVEADLHRRISGLLEELRRVPAAGSGPEEV